MEFGTLAEWSAAIVALGALAASLGSWWVSKRMERVSSRMLDLEDERFVRDRDLEQARSLHEERDQASRVFVLGAHLPDRPAAERWGFYIVNGSDRPVYRVRVESQRLDGRSENHVLELHPLPPGTFAVPGHEKFHWGELVDFARSPERISLLVKLKGKRMVTRVHFVDARGVAWCLDDGVDLRRAT